MPGSKFILITGRTTRQGTTIHRGKESEEFIEETSVVEMNEADMKRNDLQEGNQVILKTAYGSVILKCKKSDIPEGLLFLAYGLSACSLIGPDTQSIGMPDSKGMEVEVEKYGKNIS